MPKVHTTSDSMTAWHIAAVDIIMLF